MPRPRDTPVTVGELIAQGAAVSVYCEWCGKGRPARLQRILEQRGPETPMLDRLPLCTTPGCLGVRRFRDQAHVIQGFLLSARGRLEYQQHHDWLTRSRVLVRRGDLVIAKTRDLLKPD